MNPANLPFDSEAMLQGLRGWVECESPTWDAPAVERMLDIAARDMAIMGASIERIAGRQGFAGCVRARFPHPKQGEPGILIAGHLDTVHPVGTLEKLAWRREGNKCYGPGIFDMKGGNYLTLEAIRQLARAAFTTPLPITVLFTPDEEVGTPSTRDIIEAEAARNKYVLVPEPGRTNNGVVTGRYAIARFNLEAIGKPSHAGATLSSGRSAIREMARQIIAIDGMTTEDCTFSVGIVQGGQWVNCVATTCTGEALSMDKRVAATLHMVPDGMNTAASLPSRSATRSHSSFTVGSSPICSSPTSARAIASRIACVGRVCVSDSRLMRMGSALGSREAGV